MKIQKMIVPLLVISMFLISGCDLNEENADTIAKKIQNKYDKIDSYKTTMISTTGEHTKEVVREVMKPNKYKDSVISDGEEVYFSTCDGNTQIGYSKSTNKYSKVINYPCDKKVLEFFNAFDKIKNIFNYNYVIEEVELNDKEAIHVTLKSKDPTHDYWEDEFWFDKKNYQIIKNVRTDLSIGSKDPITTNFENLELNVDIADSFEVGIPTGANVEITDSQGSLDIPMPQSSIPPPAPDVEPATNEPDVESPTSEGSIFERYPGQFIKDGKLDSVAIVVGTNGDITGESSVAIDITFGLQNSAEGFASNFLDTEVSNPQQYNLVVIGSCDGTNGAETNSLMDDFSVLCSTLSEGEARMWFASNGVKTALLVIGKTVKDTINAGKVLRNYKLYDLSGNQIKVTGTDGDISMEVLS